MSNKYREAGVDLEAGYESVRLIKDHVARTKIKGAIDSIGAFGGMFDLSALHMKEPVLVSGTDGVGTKLMLAFEMDKHDTVGVDAVAMCVNDVLVQGAAPIFFLDYLAVGKNEPKKIEQLVKGVADGCVQAECALIGGETAEMPDMYAKNHYDIAGFCVGAVEKSKLLDGQSIASGQVLIGLTSSGCHSNGFSLVRKVLFKDGHLDPHLAYEELDGKILGDVLLTPTKIYVKAIKHLLDKVNIKGMSHITGGGFYENVPRMLKKGQGVTIDMGAFPRPKIFDLIAKTGNIAWAEMANVFNMGIGFILAVEREDVNTVLNLLKEIQEEAYVIGEVTDSGSVDLKW
ncbi:MAG: phosphoribosylformylglycinamidine cyclo-ligase [Erysipelotrichaceae bacterium]|nr:phosphoribosylformylglycinamidine cyclo-ligase [Erysipelotrichaceae bacterium]MCI9525080.1 phosphoribosylformylglycinamidine cyclo-ligase [Erysipelotrichaceae bacterium]